MTSEAIVVIPTLFLLGCVGLSFYALSRDRVATNIAYQKMTHLREQNRILKAFIEELTQWGRYSVEMPPRTPPLRPLFLDQEVFDD